MGIIGLFQSCLGVEESWGPVFRIGGAICTVALFNYLLLVVRHASANDCGRDARKPQIPPFYPSLVPFVGSAIKLVWDPARALRQMTSYTGILTSTRISLMGFTIYLIQDRQTVAKLWKHPSLSSSKSIYVYSMKYLFGAQKKLMSALRQDDSGAFSLPHPKSKIPPHCRIHHTIHDSLARALTGPGLDPMVQRFAKAFSRRVEALPVTADWTQMDDLNGVIKDLAGASVIEALFGPSMMALNPTFVQDLWSFDADLPWFARGIPPFLMPKAHKNRQNLIDQILRWYAYARENFHEEKIEENGDGDPVWGSEMMRYRQKVLFQVTGRDDDAMARLDLGLAWAAVANAVPAAALSAYHVFKDPQLLPRVRNTVTVHRESYKNGFCDPKILSKDPLLSSIYAETLRLYIDVFCLVKSTDKDAHLGRWVLPQDNIVLVNSGTSHMDASFWNTQNMKHPVDSFWAERFCTSPGDPSTGPMNPELTRLLRIPDPEKSQDAKPFFSTRGIEGSWFPYGGGPIICPGRFFSKHLMIFTYTLLASRFDIKILDTRLKFNKQKNGLGVKQLISTLPFQIKKRDV